MIILLSSKKSVFFSILHFWACYFPTQVSPLTLEHTNKVRLDMFYQKNVSLSWLDKNFVNYIKSTDLCTVFAFFSYWRQDFSNITGNFLSKLPQPRCFPLKDIPLHMPKLYSTITSLYFSCYTFLKFYCTATVVAVQSSTCWGRHNPISQGRLTSSSFIDDSDVFFVGICQAEKSIEEIKQLLCSVRQFTILMSTGLIPEISREENSGGTEVYNPSLEKQVNDLS